jgi:hypothetical protein
MGKNEINFDDLILPLDIKTDSQLKKFYSLWSINAAKLIKTFVEDKSIQWYNVKWRNKSKQIHFYIRTKAPKGSTGNVFFASRPINAAYSIDSTLPKPSYIKLPKGHVSPVLSNNKWFTPKKYKPDVHNIDTSEVNMPDGNNRFFVCKTSDNKTKKYKKPLLWYQNKSTKKVGFVTLKEQPADIVNTSYETYQYIYQAFNDTVEAHDYL